MRIYRIGKGDFGNYMDMDKFRCRVKKKTDGLLFVWCRRGEADHSHPNLPRRFLLNTCIYRAFLLYRNSFGVIDTINLCK